MKALTVGDLRRLLQSPNLTDDMVVGSAQLGDEGTVLPATFACIHRQGNCLLFDSHPDAELIVPVDDCKDLASIEED